MSPSNTDQAAQQARNSISRTAQDVNVSAPATAETGVVENSNRPETTRQVLTIETAFEIYVITCW